jgi:predicted outer membrane repeat protein
MCGGDLNLANLAVANIDSVSFSGSTAEMGGSICTYDVAKLSLVNSVVTDARSTKEGGGCLAAVYEFFMEIVGTTISGCNSAAYGGGLVIADQAKVAVTNCTVTNTTAAYQGGSMCVGGNGSLAVVDTVLTNGGIAGDAGGCVYGEGNSSIKLAGTTVTGCSAKGAGGGVYVTGLTNLDMADCILRNNTATMGAALFVESNSKTTVQSSLFEGNRATERGGAIYGNSQAQVDALPSQPGVCATQGLCLPDHVMFCCQVVKVVDE